MIAEHIAAQGNVIDGGTPEEFGAFIDGEATRWTKVVKEKKIQAN